MSALTDAERHILEHSLGWTSRNPGYRNHYTCGDDSDAWPTLQALVARGLMRVSRPPAAWLPMTTFVVTPDGIAALKPRGAS